MALLEAIVQFVRLINVMNMTFNQCFLLLTVLNKATEHPKQGVYPEHGKGADQQAHHGLESPVHQGIVLAIMMAAVGIKLGKQCCCLGVTLGTGLGCIVGVDR